MTTVIDDENVAQEIYEGAPDDLMRHINGSQEEMSDIAQFMRTFTSPSQRTTKQTLAWYNEEASSPPFDPDGMCLKVCRTARNIGPMYASALEAQQATPDEHRVRKISSIRRGMVVYYDTIGDSNPFGHIVTVCGRDKNMPSDSLASLIVWTNSVVANKLVKVRGDYFQQHWGDQFQFAATWLNGQDLVPSFASEPEPKPVARSTEVQAMHISMRTFLRPALWKQDCQAIFSRARDRGRHWITGTEAGRPEHRELLREVGKAHGFAVRLGEKNDSWIAVRREFAKGEIVGGNSPVIEEPRSRGIVTASFETENLGQITIGACHYLRFGRPDAKSDEYQQYLRENKKLAKTIGELAEATSRGSGLFFYGGDQNIPDNLSDTFFGEHLTSSWDELAKWDNTGHGNIDVIASYDRDGRVSAKWVRRLRDSEFPLHTDHYLVETGFDVLHLSS